VIDAALADELRIAALVAHVEAQHPRRQLIAENRRAHWSKSW